jgi:hypothetical protein
MLPVPAVGGAAPQEKGAIVTMKKAIRDFLAPYSPEVRSLALKARALVLDLVPDVREQIDAPAKIIGYGFGPKYADTICVIMPAKAWVNLGFYRATELPDPDSLLEGTGKLHRHVKLRGEEDVDSPALRKLLLAALDAYKQRSGGGN